MSVRKGEREYKVNCITCHGKNGQGREDMQAPRINHLQDWYLERSIRNFMTGKRGTHEKDFQGKLMRGMVLRFSEKQLQNVVAYVKTIGSDVRDHVMQ